MAPTDYRVSKDGADPTGGFPTLDDAKAFAQKSMPGRPLTWHDDGGESVGTWSENPHQNKPSVVFEIVRVGPVSNPASTSTEP